jgi:cytochrome c-type biogenesis protein CcmH
MSWLMVIGLALSAMALAAAAFVPARRGWATFAAALALGLAGYALQASPDVPGAPTSGLKAAETTDWNLVDARKEMVAEDDRSTNNGVVLADAYSRQQRHVEAVAMLHQVLTRDPRDGEAWLALGNALVEHANGTLTEPAMVAYRRAEEITPGAVGPGYFLGLSLVRQGQLPEAIGVWKATLEGANAEATGRAALQERLARLEALLANPELLAPRSGG